MQRRFTCALAGLVLGLSLAGCAKKEMPPLAVPAVDPLMARKVIIDKSFKDAIVFNGASVSREDGFDVTVNLLNRFDKPQRCTVRWEWIDASGMTFSPGRDDKPQVVQVPGRQSLPLVGVAPQPGVDDWKAYVTPVGR